MLGYGRPTITTHLHHHHQPHVHAYIHVHTHAINDIVQREWFVAALVFQYQFKSTKMQTHLSYFVHELAPTHDQLSKCVSPAMN